MKELTEMTYKELVAIAKENGLPYVSIKKDDLLLSIQKFQSGDISEVKNEVIKHTEVSNKKVWTPKKK
jgi:hypothetical protein